MVMHAARAFAGLFFVLAFASGCVGESSVLYPTGPTSMFGSGRFVSESRPVQAFTVIAVSGGIRVTVTHGGGESLEITAEDNILPLIESRVVGDRLVLGLLPVSGGVSSRGIDARVGVRALLGVEASGGSRIVADVIDGPAAVLLSGAASLSTAGSVARLEMNLSGASRLVAPELTAGVVTARLSGASAALLRVVESLTVNASGASFLEFYGDPIVRSDVSGASTVRRVGP